MARYIYNCKECGYNKTIAAKPQEYNNIKNNIVCDKCGAGMSRVFSRTFNQKIDKSSAEIVESLVREKEKIIEKFNSGDLKTISDICGED